MPLLCHVRVVQVWQQLHAHARPLECSSWQPNARRHGFHSASAVSTTLYGVEMRRISSPRCFIVLVSDHLIRPSPWQGRRIRCRRPHLRLPFVASLAQPLALSASLLLACTNEEFIGNKNKAKKKETLRPPNANQYFWDVLDHNSQSSTFQEPVLVLLLWEI